MQYQPHDYQTRATQLVIDKPKIGLFLDMGLGKTVITMTAIQELMYDRFEISRVLVIAPKRVAEDTWTREHAKWDHLKDLRISKVLGNEQQRIRALRAEADIYVIGRDNVIWLINYYQGLRKGWPFDMIVIDELSSFKNPQAKRFRALKKAMPSVSRVVGLTGTPSPNGLMDLWAEVYLLDRGERLGLTLGSYRERYFRPGARNGYVVYKWEPFRNAQKICRFVAEREGRVKIKKFRKLRRIDAKMLQFFLIPCRFFDEIEAAAGCHGRERGDGSCEFPCKVGPEADDPKTVKGCSRFPEPFQLIPRIGRVDDRAGTAVECRRFLLICADPVRHGMRAAEGPEIYRALRPHFPVAQKKAVPGNGDADDIRNTPVFLQDRPAKGEHVKGKPVRIIKRPVPDELPRDMLLPRHPGAGYIVIKQRFDI